MSTPLQQEIGRLHRRARGTEEAVEVIAAGVDQAAAEVKALREFVPRQVAAVEAHIAVLTLTLADFLAANGHAPAGRFKELVDESRALMAEADGAGCETPAG